MEIIKTLKTKNLKVVAFKVPIYDSRVCFIKHDGNKGYDQALRFCEELGLNIEDYKDESWKNCYGFVTMEKVKIGFVHFVFINIRRDYKPDYINTLSHETYHVVDNISKRHGLKRAKNGDNEHLAYLTGYLFDAFYKF